MKRIVLTMSALLICVIASAQVEVIAKSGMSELSYYAEGDSFHLNMRDGITGDEFHIFMSSKQHMMGLLDILDGILSERFPDGLAVNNVGDIATIWKDAKNNVLLVECKGAYCIIDSSAISIFRKAITSLKK